MWIALRMGSDVRVWDALSARRRQATNKSVGNTLRGRPYAHTLSTRWMHEVSFALANPWEHGGRDDDAFVRAFCSHPEPQIGFPSNAAIAGDIIASTVWIPVLFPGGDEPIEDVNNNKLFRIARLTLEEITP